MRTKNFPVLAFYAQWNSFGSFTFQFDVESNEGRLDAEFGFDVALPQNI
jgi:hypothetical protein